MAGRMVCAIALGIPVLAGLAYLGLSGAPFVYIASNGLALVVALAATAFLRVRLSDRQCRILSVLLLLLLYVHALLVHPLLVVHGDQLLLALYGQRLLFLFAYGVLLLVGPLL